MIAFTQHPSKIRNINQNSDISFARTSFSTDSNDSTNESDKEVSPFSTPDKKSYSSAKAVATAVNKTKISYNKASAFLTHINDDINASCPQLSVSGIRKASIEAARKAKQEILLSCSSVESLALYFDWKTINFCGRSVEFIVVAVKNETFSSIIGLKGLIDGRTALHCFNEIMKCIIEFKISNKIKMIVTDTAAVNTGAKSGVIKRLKDS